MWRGDWLRSSGRANGLDDLIMRWDSRKSFALVIKGGETTERVRKAHLKMGFLIAVKFAVCEIARAVFLRPLRLQEQESQPT